MIRDLFIAEAQTDPYVWAAVLLAHFAIGVCLRSLGMKLAVIAALYIAFEIVQAAVGDTFLLWDSALDFVAVMLGALSQGRMAVIAIAIIAAVGSYRRK